MGPSVAQGEALLSIGEFSRYAGLSVRMLRHYAERGILVPASVDAHSGYRRYRPEQLRDAGRVRLLCDAGCGIPTIAELVPVFDEPTVLRERLQRHLAELQAEAARVAEQQTVATDLLEQFGTRVRDYVVTERTFPAVRVLYLRRTVTDYPAEGSMWQDFRGPVGELSTADPGAFGSIGGATYFDDEYRDDDVEMAIWREYRGTSIPDGGYEIVDLPEQRVATVTHRGAFDTISDAAAAAGRWITEQRRERVGPLFNVYINGPGRNPDPTTWVTEVNVPIGRAATPPRPETGRC